MTQLNKASRIHQEDQEHLFQNSYITGNYRMYLRIARPVSDINEGYGSGDFWLCTDVSNPAMYLYHL